MSHQSLAEKEKQKRKQSKDVKDRKAETKGKTHSNHFKIWDSSSSFLECKGNADRKVTEKMKTFRHFYYLPHVLRTPTGEMLTFRLYQDIDKCSI